MSNNKRYINAKLVDLFRLDVKYILETLNVPYVRLAEVSGVSKQYLSEIVNGKQTDIRESTFCALMYGLLTLMLYRFERSDYPARDEMGMLEAYRSLENEYLDSKLGW